MPRVATANLSFKLSSESTKATLAAACLRAPGLRTSRVQAIAEAKGRD